METPKLSPAKINPTKLLPGTSISEKKISTQNLQEGSISVLKSDLFIIKKQVFKVRDLIQTSTLIKQSELEKKRKSTEKKGAEEQENKLEAKPEKKEGKLKMPSVPKLGFLDRIKNFLFSVLLGYISIKLLPHLPKLVGIVSIIGNVMEFMIDLGGNILDKVVTFIDWGYKAIDATRGFMKSFGGDFSLKIFDTFTGAVSGVIDAAIIAAIALSTQGMGGGGGPDGGRLRVGGKGAGRVDPGVARRYAERFGRDAALKKFGKEGVESLGGKYARSGVTNLARKGLVGLAGKGGAKAVLGFARPFLKRLPIIGALIDFGLSVALGEDPGRAAFKAIGAGLLGFVGAAIGGPFAILTGLAGGAAGDWAGGALYDAFFGGKKPKAQKPQAVKAAGGGPAPVTRGNKIVGGAVKRTISRKPVKRGVKVQVTKVKPGGSIGGKKKLEKIFPEVPTKDKGKNVNPLGYMQSSYDIATKTPSFGALFALPLKAQLGEKPSSVDYMKAAEELSGWMQNTFRGTAGYAGGGKVEAGMFGGEDTTNVIAKSLEENISSKVDAAIKELQKQLMLKEEEKKSEDKKTGPDGGGAMGTGEYSPEGLQGEIYQYLLSKGLDDTHALGLMANISRESGFRPGVTEEGGGGGVGLFQYTNEPRKGNFLKAVPNYKTNWKGQIDYALKEPGEPGPQWIGMKFSSPQEAADWFMRKWERPAEYIQNTEGPKIHAEYIKSLEKYRTKKGTLDFPKGADLGRGDGTFIQGNSGRSDGTHFHIGTNKPGDGSGVAASGFNVIKHFLGKKSIYVGRSGEFIPAGAKDEEIQGYVRRGQAAHRQTELDLQIGGMGAGNKVAFPLALRGLKYSNTDGYGVSADIVGTNAFVGHGRYKPDGTLAAQQRTVLNTGAPDFYAFHGMNKIITKDSLLKVHKGEYISVTDADSFKLVGNILTDINSIENRAQLVARMPSIIEKLKKISGYAGYEDGAEQTVIVMNNPQMVPIPIPTGNSGSIGGMSRSSSIDTTYDIQYANA